MENAVGGDHEEPKAILGMAHRFAEAMKLAVQEIVVLRSRKGRCSEKL